MLLDKFLKFFLLPTPVELGWSQSNALPVRFFQLKKLNDTRPTWEDWHEKMQKEYPIRYFLLKTAPIFYRSKIKAPFRKMIYWFKSHLIPSRRYHMLDLRQPKEKGRSEYRYGWLDADQQMKYALFNILNNFVKNEFVNFACPNEEEIQSKPILLGQRNAWMEIKAIHYWWNVERKRKEKLISEITKEWHQASMVDTERADILWSSYSKIEKEFSDKTEEMIIRLIKVRHYLWT